MPQWNKITYVDDEYLRQNQPSGDPEDMGWLMWCAYVLAVWVSPLIVAIYAAIQTIT